MLRKLIGRMVKRKGMVGLLIIVGDFAVKASKSKKDDEIWAEVRTLLESF